MIQQNDNMIAAVSGGADSVCLLHLLVQIRTADGIRLRAVHVHHGLRGEEADRDAAFTEELCRKFDVPCRILHADVRGYAREHSVSEEEAGRILRYQLLEQEAQRWEAETGGQNVKIAVAHHGDDSAETILSPYYWLQQNDIVYVTPNKAKARNSDIGSSTSLWLSATSILVSLASLLVTIFR